MDKFYSKIYRQQGKTVLAVCDKTVHNKTFEDERISFHVDPDFYGDNGVSVDELSALMEGASIINLAGRGCIELAIELGHVDPDTVLYIGNFCHVQVIRV